MATCNLCGFPVLRLTPGIFGTRCLRCGSTLLHRAAGFVIAQLGVPPTARVYELSSGGPLVRYLRRRCQTLTLSEYFDDVRPGEWKRGVQCQDVQRLTYPDDAFDLVTSTEVFEHVPDDTAAFREVHRVLRPGGHVVFTVPLFDQERTVERARLDGGAVVHLLAPEYHHDRIRGRGRVLAFRNYGRDICRRLGAAGLEAEIRVVDAARHAAPGTKVVVGRKADRQRPAR
ncbi:MAG: class I SAM-dependent methyltransferase [Candidatus Rokuibacteriota bacterium]